MKTRTSINAFLAISLWASTFISHFAFPQSSFSLSAGPDFATLQLLIAGHTTPIYENDDIKVGIAIPFSVTGNFTYNSFMSNMKTEPEEMNINGMLTVAGGGYVAYKIQSDFEISGTLGYGVVGNTEPYSITTEEGERTFNMLDYMDYNLYLQLAGKYQKFGLQFTTQGDLLQVFATYNVSNKFFVGLGYRKLDRVVTISDDGLSTPSGLQATIGLNW